MTDEEIVKTHSGLATTDREIFNEIVAGLLAQGELSMSGEHGGMCYYRYKKDNGVVLKCAVGQIISDIVYEQIGGENLENCVVKSASVLVAVQESNPYWKLTTDSRTMLFDLQRAHDKGGLTPSRPDIWADQLKECFESHFAEGGSYTPNKFGVKSV